MAHVRRHPRSGRWQVRYRDPGGRERSRTFTRKVDADRFAASTELASELSEKRDVTKTLLRDFAKPYLPSRIVGRRKVGFPVPVHTWFSGPYRNDALEILLDWSTRAAGIINCDRVESWFSDDEFLADHANGLKVWMLLNLALWHREYLG